MRTLEANGEVIAYERAGTGPTLLLLHSLGTASWLWREQLRRWQADFDVIAFDLRGHGASSNNGGVSLDAIAADTVAALEAMGIAHVHLVGISMGGLVCARIYERAPDVVRSVVVADSFASLGDNGPKRVEQLEQHLATASMAEYGKIYSNETLLPEAAVTHGGELQRSIGRMDAAAYLQTARSVFTEDARDRWRALRVPALIVVGEADKRTPPTASEEIASLVPGSQIKVIPRAGHLSNLDNPIGFHEAVDPFLIEAASVARGG